MRVSHVAAALLALAIGGEASPVNTPKPVHEKRQVSASSRYAKRSRVHEDAILPVRIGLAQTGLEHGYDHVMDVYVACRNLVTTKSLLICRQFRSKLSKLWQALDS